MTNRIEFLASDADADLLDEIVQLMGMDRSHVLRLSIRRLAVTMKTQGWPIELPGDKNSPKSTK